MPGDDGGCESNPAAFSPRTKFIYYGTRYEPTTFRTHSGKKELIPTATGDLHLGSRFFEELSLLHELHNFTDTTGGAGRTR